MPFTAFTVTQDHFKKVEICICECFNGLLHEHSVSFMNFIIMQGQGIVSFFEHLCKSGEADFSGFVYIFFQ